MTQKVWLITGCSSGIGRAVAQAALARGDKVIATARAPISRLTELEKAGAIALEFDVTGSLQDVQLLVDKAISVFGHIDVVVPNAGIAEYYFVEYVTQEVWLKQFQTNFFGVTNLVNSLLPHFRARKTGYIAFTNSVFAHISTTMCAPYAASKHAISGYAKTLKQEVAQLGIHPIVFDIGHIRTPIGAKAHLTSPSADDYSQQFQAMKDVLGTLDGNQPGDPELCAERMVDVVRGEGLAAGKPVPLMVPIGKDACLTIRKAAEAELKACDTWQELAGSVETPEPRRGFFAMVDHYYFE